MADNKQLPPTGTGTANIVVATDEIAGVDYQKIKLVDGTADSTTAAKVSSEGNLQTITPDRTASGTLDADEEAITLACEGLSVADIVITSGSLTGSISYEQSSDGGTSWNYADVYDETSSFTFSSTTNPSGPSHLGLMTLAGRTHVRVRCDAYTSGSIVVSIVGSVGSLASRFVVLGNSPGYEITTVTGGGQAGLLVAGIRDESSGAGVSVGGGIEAGALRVTVASDSTGVLSVDDNGGALTVDGTVTAAAQPGVDIGDVTVNNAAGASAVNIQDGGNTITVDGTVAVTGVSTAANQTTEITALQKIDDPVQVLGTDTYTEATSSGMTMGAVRRDADTTLVGTTNEFGPLQMDANGRLKVEAFSGETLPVSLTSTTVTGTVAVTQSGTWDEVGINDSGNSITVDAPNGTPVFARITDATLNMGVVDETGASAVDAAAVGGGTPHDAVDSGNPIKMGGKASTAVPTAVAAADRTNAWVDVYGRQIVQAGVPVGTEKWATAQYTSAQTGTALLTPTSGKKLIITSVQIGVGGTTAGTVQLWFGGSADTTYTRGTDRAIFDHEFKPSATLAPGFAQTKESGWAAAAADDVLRVTTSAAVNPITFTVWGYEV